MRGTTILKPLYIVIFGSLYSNIKPKPDQYIAIIKSIFKMTKSILFLVVTLFVILFFGVLEATEKNLLHQYEDFMRSKSSPLQVTGRAIPPSGPSQKEPLPPVPSKANINMWSPSQRLAFGMLPKHVPIWSGPSGKTHLAPAEAPL